MMLPRDAAMTTRRSSLGGPLAGISLPYWLNAFPTLRLLRLVRPREQSRDCEEISEGVEEGAGGRGVQREDHESPEDVQRSLRSRAPDQRKQAYEEEGGGNTAAAPRPGPLMASRGSGSSVEQAYTDDGARSQGRSHLAV